jgi:hypothetical protein
MRHVALAVVALLVASPAFAQFPYVVGSFGMDVSRFGQIDTGFDTLDRHGEVMSGALRVGTTIGERWGLELELARGGDIEDESSFDPRILAGNSITFSSSTPGTAPSVVSLLPISFRQRLEQRHQTIATLAWIRQRVADRVDLAYIGGIGFWRTAREQEVSFGFPTLPAFPAGVVPGFPVRPTILPPPTQTTRTTTYGVDPVVGVEAHIGLTDHVRLVPGLRMQGIGDVEGKGWMLRAGVGLGWFF